MTAVGAAVFSNVPFEQSANGIFNPNHSLRRYIRDQVFKKQDKASLFQTTLSGISFYSNLKTIAHFFLFKSSTIWIHALGISLFSSSVNFLTVKSLLT